MTRRHTPEKYHELAASKNAKWLGPEVPNTQTKTWWLCSRGHKWATMFGNFKNWGCPYCSNKAPKTPSDYEKLATEKDLKWLGPDVPNVHTKTEWECLVCGYRWWTKYHSLDNQKGCPSCAGRVPKTSADYEKLGEENGFDWLGPFPSGIHKKTRWQCQSNHTWDAPFNRLQQGHGCPHCARVAPKTERDYLDLAEKMGFQWQGPMVASVTIKTQWLCGKQHTFLAPFSSVQNGIGCSICAGNKPKVAADYRRLADKRGFTWHGPMVPNTVTKTVWECEKDSTHRWEAPYSNIRSGSGCPHCDREAQSQRSKEMWASGTMDDVFQSPTSIEIAVSKALDELGLKHEIQYRPDGYSRVFDEWIPPDILLEVQGSYWHGPDRPEQQEKDAEKAEWAKDNGFALVVLWEDEINELGACQLIEERILPLL